MHTPTEAANSLKIASSWRGSLAWVVVGLVVLLAHLSLEQRQYWQQDLTGQVGSLPTANLVLLPPQQVALPAYYKATDSEGGDNNPTDSRAADFLLLLFDASVQVVFTGYLVVVYLAPRTANYSPRSPPRI